MWSCLVCHIIIRSCKSLAALQQSVMHYNVSYMLRMNCNNMVNLLWFRLLDIIKHHCIGRELSIYHVCMWHVFNLLSTACSGIIRALLGFTEGLFTVLHCSWQCYNEAAQPLTCTQALSVERYGWWSIWSSSPAIDCVSNTSLTAPCDLIMQ